MILSLLVAVAVVALPVVFGYAVHRWANGRCRTAGHDMDALGRCRRCGRRVR